MPGTGSPSTSAALCIGLMSGTSLDGVDAVLAQFGAQTFTPQSALGHHHVPFPAELRAALLALQHSGPDELHRAALASKALAEVYASLIATLLRQTGKTADEVLAVGAHGQTVRHRPELGYTLQLNAPARLAELCGITVVADFRSRDVAAGGQGAPLVPAFHADLFGDPTHHRAVLNIGGIANITDLPAGTGQAVRGWDTGPGNCLLDGWVQIHRQQAYDANGAWAASGRVQAALLGSLLAEPWLQGPPPKSTGRDLFNMEWLAARLRTGGALRPEDVQATLAEFTARCIARDIGRFCAGVEEVIVCGGGVLNGHLMDRLASTLLIESRTPVALCSSADHGLPPDEVEALAFAWLAWRHMNDLPGNLPAVTGARGLRVLGARYPA